MQEHVSAESPGVADELEALRRRNAELEAELVRLRADLLPPDVEALQLSEERFRILTQAMPALIYITGADGLNSYVNDEYQRYTGLDAEQLLGFNWRQVIHPDDLDAIASAAGAAFKAGRPYNGEFRMRGADGNYRWFICRSVPTRGVAGQITGTVGTCIDIDDRKRAEEALQRATEQAEAQAAERAAILGQLVEGVIVADRDGSITFVNEAAAKLHGTARLGVQPSGYSSTYQLFTEDGRPYPSTELPLARAVLRGETVTDARWTIRRADGTLLLVIGSARPVIAADGTKLGAVLTLRDDTARAAAETALRDSEAKFRTITEAMPQMVWSTRADGYHDYFNSRWYEYTGTSEGATDGEQWSTMVHPEDRERAWARWRISLATGEIYEIEYRLRHRTGEYRWVLARAMPVRDRENRIIRWMGTCTDIDDQVLARDTLTRSHDELERRVVERTRDLASALERLRSEVAERERAEEALRQAQKMEAVGQLTGGIAHDFNNLLTIVIGNMDMAQRSLSTGDELRARRAIENAAKGAERAATLTQRLLAFSRRQPLAPKPVDVNKLIAGMSDLLKRSLGETVEIETQLADNLWRTEADPNQLENAILNLAVNARDAMPNGGKLTIETCNARLDGGQAAGPADSLTRSYVMIAVSDTGHGMSKNVLDRAFEPFFTTKEVGKGTGLGLSQVYGFVSQSGGQVKIVSQEGQGTTIRVYLPRLAAEAEPVDVVDHIDTTPESRAETVLVVEDDDDVRAYTVEILTELGYRVLEAPDGAAALRLLDDATLSVQLLFTDVVMPGMTGRELADAARVRRPELRVLYTTGYARDAITQNGGRLDQGVELIAKPFTYRALAAKVRDVLDTA